MLLDKDLLGGNYIIAVNNFTNRYELIADLSLIEDGPDGVITFDFTHMSANLRSSRDEVLPGGFGYQPTLHLIEVVSALASNQVSNLRRHNLCVRLPDPSTRIGKFVADMHVGPLLQAAGLCVSISGKSLVEVGEDDISRQNLIPLTNLRTEPNVDYAQIQQIHDRCKNVFQIALPSDANLATRFASVVGEAVDNVIEYGKGGIIGGLYYPRIGEVEITLSNHEGGFGGNVPDEELDALLKAFEGDVKRTSGGNGIRELSRLTANCFGTLLLQNGRASLYLHPDGSIVCHTKETGFEAPGAFVTLVIQLMPNNKLERTEAIDLYEPVIASALKNYNISGRRS